MDKTHNRKGYIAPLAMFVLAVGVIIVIATMWPGFKQTAIDILNAIFGSR